MSKWLDIKGQKSSLFYIIGAIDDTLLNQFFPKDQDETMFSEDEIKDRDIKKKDSMSIHYGKLDVDSLLLGALF